jgi:hypothetical protein
MIIACAALAVALSGTSYAAFALPANSVGAKQLRKSAVTSKKIAKSAVTGAKVKDESLGGADIRESNLGTVPASTHSDSATSAASASALNGYAANGLARVARMLSAETLTLTISGQTYGTPLSITAPDAGFVLITGSFTVVATASCTTGCNAEAWIHHVGGSDYSMGALGSVSNAATNRYANLAPVHVFPVAAGVNTFELAVVRSPGDGEIKGILGSLTALYTPFGSTGGGTLGSTHAIGGRGR